MTNPRRAKKAAQEFHATATNDGQYTVGTLSGSAPNIEARDLDNQVIGVFPTRAEAVAAIIAARAERRRRNQNG
jgi:hypothetical protein